MKFLLKPRKHASADRYIWTSAIIREYHVRISMVKLLSILLRQRLRKILHVVSWRGACSGAWPSCKRVGPVSEKIAIRDLWCTNRKWKNWRFEVDVKCFAFFYVFNFACRPESGMDIFLCSLASHVRVVRRASSMRGAQLGIMYLGGFSASSFFRRSDRSTWVSKNTQQPWDSFSSR